LNITAHYAEAKSTGAVIAAVDAEIDRLATDGTEPGELDRVRTKLAATIFRELDQVLNRSLEFAKFQLLFGDASLITELPRLLAQINDADIRAAAAQLTPSSRAVVELVPGASA
jgi:predicted Zn-dependent peptidase